jgi:FAD/FMN-containing dehydrogenase
MLRRTFLGAASAATISMALLRDRAWADIPIPAELAAVKLDGQATALKRSDIEDLRAGLRGPLLLPGEAGYDDARVVWNAAYDRHPALIARCAGAADIARALQFGASHNLLVAVHGGGHSSSGQSVCEGGLMIDLSLMRSVRIDPNRKTARVEPGVLLGALDREALAFGLVTTTGMVSHTGAAGLTLGGGCGRIARRFGLAVDNLAGVDVISPDGILRAATAKENPDLFWAVRGGSGNFGVASSLEYNLHPFDPMVYGGQLHYSFDDAREVLRFFADFMADAPNELWITTAIGDVEKGQRALTFDICYRGPVANGERLLKPLRDFRKPLRDEVGPVAYTTLQTHGDIEGRFGLRRYQTSGYLLKLEPALVDAVLAQFTDANARPLRFLIMPWGGGAIARVAKTDTAYWHRDIRWNVQAATSWQNEADSDACKARARDAWKAIEPLTHGFYANSITGRDATNMHGAYGGNYERLARIKKKYDPSNLLRMNANVVPM